MPEKNREGVLLGPVFDAKEGGTWLGVGERDTWRGAGRGQWLERQASVRSQSLCGGGAHPDAIHSKAAPPLRKQSPLGRATGVGLGWFQDSFWVDQPCSIFLIPSLPRQASSARPSLLGRLPAPAACTPESQDGAMADLTDPVPGTEVAES